MVKSDKNISRPEGRLFLRLFDIDFVKLLANFGCGRTHFTDGCFDVHFACGFCHKQFCDSPGNGSLLNHELGFDFIGYDNVFSLDGFDDTLANSVV